MACVLELLVMLGGDGLVAARHLGQFGFRPSLFYPKRTEKAFYKSLVTQVSDACG